MSAEREAGGPRENERRSRLYKPWTASPRRPEKEIEPPYCEYAKVFECRHGPLRARRRVKRLLVLLGAWAALAVSAPVLAALSFTSQPPSSATVGQRYVYTMTAANVAEGGGSGGGDKPDSRGRLHFIARVLPVWLQFDGYDTIYGTPGPGDVGQQHVKLRAQIRGDKVDQDFTITVVPGSSGPPPTGADLAASVAVNPNPVSVDTPVTWKVTPRNLSARDVANAVLETVFSGDAPLTLDGVDDASCSTAPRGGDTAVTCRWSPLPAGASKSAVVTGHASAPGEIVADARVSVADASPIDSNPGNDAARAVLSVTGAQSAAPAQVLSAPGAAAVAVADFDGDGRDDLAVATGAGEPVLIFRNDRTQDPAHPFATAAIPVGGATSAGTAIAAADLDGDGAADIVVANADGPSEVLFNDGAAAFVRAALQGSGGGSRGIAIADVDGDSLPDIVLANDGPSTVYRNLGNREFAAEPLAVESSTSVLAADLLGDGRSALVFTHADRDADLYAWRGGAYAPAGTLATGPAAAVAAADFDADGRADLAFARGGADLVLLNAATASPSFTVAARLGEAESVAVLAGDFDGDGRNNVVTIGASGAHRLYTNDGSAPPGFVGAEGFSGPPATGAAQGLFDAGAMLDVAVAGSDVVDVFLNIGGAGSGTGASGAAPVLTLNGASSVTVTVGAAYQDPGATATDAADGDLTSQIVVDNPIDTSVIGRYSVTYEVVDRAGNMTTATRTVVVVARKPSGGGGGGAAGPLLWLLLCGAACVRRAGRPDMHMHAGRPPKRRKD